ncbi:MAG TPA: DPP IV N-terminal domain-containing protein [bacterium]|nr:DPP IV N-terminal domain-containing protein [bacterium]
MKRTLSRVALALALLPWAGACRKAAPPPPPVVHPTPTPMPLSDNLVYTHSGQLWMARADGSPARVLAVPGQGQAYWLPVGASDGGVLAWLSKADGSQNLVHVGLDGSVQPLTDIGVPALPDMKNVRLGNAPSVSPDGKRIAYGFNGDLWIMDANGYNAETLISDGASYAPAFSPDGKQIAYVNGRRGHYDLWISDLSSHDTYQVTDFEGYSVGRPQWLPNGQRVMMTRVRGDESDLVQVLAATDTPLADSDVLTKDHLSAGAVISPSGIHLLFSSARASAPGQDGVSPLWDIFLADVTGNNAKRLSTDGGIAPAWINPAAPGAAAGAAANLPLAQSSAPPARPAAPSAAPFAPPPAPMAPPAVNAQPPAPAQPQSPMAPPPRPQAPAQGAGQAPAANPALPPRPPQPGQAPMAGGAALPPKPAAPGMPGGQAPAASGQAPMARPAAPATGTAAQGVAAAPSAQAAPTQPPLKAAPLRLRYQASFDAKDKLSPAGLANLRKLAQRVTEYSSEQVSVFGPLDSSPLRGHYASPEARSKARAQAVATELAKQAKFPPSRVKPLPYSPPASGGMPNSIQIYVELK